MVPKYGIILSNIHNQPYLNAKMIHQQYNYLSMQHVYDLVNTASFTERHL